MNKKNLSNVFNKSVFYGALAVFWGSAFALNVTFGSPAMLLILNASLTVGCGLLSVANAYAMGHKDCQKSAEDKVTTVKSYSISFKR
jgi:hypothetical protein